MFHVMCSMLCVYLFFLFSYFFKRIYYFFAFVISAMRTSLVLKFLFSAFRTSYCFYGFNFETISFSISSLLCVPLFWYWHKVSYKFIRFIKFLKSLSRYKPLTIIINDKSCVIITRILSLGKINKMIEKLLLLNNCFPFRIYIIQNSDTGQNHHQRASAIT